MCLCNRRLCEERPGLATPPHGAELDLRPFGKLLSVLGMLRCDDDALPAVLRRMPRCLESLCITAEGSPEPRDFDAGKPAA